MPNGMSSGCSRRDVPNAGLFGTDTIPTVEISTMEQLMPYDGRVVGREFGGELLQPNTGGGRDILVCC